MIKFTTYLSEAGAGAERQENGFVEAINDAFKLAKKGITVKTKDMTVRDIVKAEKFTGRSKANTEPYTDVIITTAKNKKYNLSMKGNSAPSLAGGGLAGMELVIPGIGMNFMKAALAHHKKNLKPGEKVPDLFAKLNDKDKNLLVIGNTSMGGPIDYMYIGPMDVVSSFDEKKNILTLNGKISDAKKYANSKDLFFRLRARREDQTFDPTKKDRAGIPTVYGKSPSRGDSKGRIVVTDKPSKSRSQITF
mgnify:FL=1|tara:strand:+ start:756 stop:1502 length:747 start_codon:yes stop_codon:yes gene_type:complete